ncbi:MAG TPA: hypothetical protein P5279_01475 [Anaerohalosphaeraceae bacterium]|nr:hypothetical protein [Anaerohalosphaeraceae bacterium]HRT49138.1 hypothetical protein [Anaerohalosphaeraceae bacterium]HRT88164.1 hypothetical protein [Anaerohalosphaeraceae bacterium]
MTEQNNRPGSVDSDILQGKADVLRAVQSAAQGGGDRNSASKHTPDAEKKAPVQVEVRPVVAIRSDRERLSSAPPKDGGTAKPAEPEQKRPVAGAGSGTAAEKPQKDAGDNAAPAVEKDGGSEAVKAVAEPEAEAKAVAEAAANAETGELKSQSGGGVPRFKLAEQILAEQRRNASERRQRSNAGAGTRTYAAEDTVGEVIREVKNNLGPAAGTAGAAVAAMKAAGDGIAVDEKGLTSMQREIVAEIVARDIALYSGGVARRRVWPGNGNN